MSLHRLFSWVMVIQGLWLLLRACVESIRIVAIFGPSALGTLAVPVFGGLMLVLLRDRIATWILGKSSDVVLVDHRGLLVTGVASLGIHLWIEESTAFYLRFGSLDVRATRYLWIRHGHTSRASDIDPDLIFKFAFPLLLATLLVVTARWFPMLAGWGGLEKCRSGADT